MRNIGMVLSYDGTAYCGFQAQPELDTVQGRIERAIYMLTNEQTSIMASGRTDAGVHAYGQVFNFATASMIPADRWCLALNSRLPDDIVIREAWEAPQSFHARYSAKRKTYRYSICAERQPDVFRRNYEFHYHRPLDMTAMQEAVRYFVGEHDFTSFVSPKSTKTSNVRTLYTARLDIEPSETGEEGRGRLHLELTGNGFLYNMVRIIAGTLLRVGERKLIPADIPRILEAKSRKAAGPTAVPHGLTLWHVDYNGEEQFHTDNNASK
ncbi:tRNA pseudouridine(38-40) synthase TruA [Paenibacillus sp. MER TA 81-3]|uniref:tRNA pseudouridine(38-40) synthase TruA n=1 Tax=Paenibacillus sp. MER TA 81-3 TaxID=2939573 RepID=UPI002040667E|nr:tRNA pseudouridine(38-40) synthase TruA [Paenibacillus sp. MER TA 81-3]MCM3342387.1 tRNA pseudouridine(38-40) synthase TruA [Paenibacillus sp. MER TA 81-3]